MSTEPWQKAEIPGPIKAVVIPKPQMVSALIKRAKNPIFVVGHKVADTEFEAKKPIDYIIRIAKSANISVVATAHTIKEFLKRNYESVTQMSLMDIGYRLTDREWSVSDKNPPHDLALFIGFPYYMEWLVESGLKSYAFQYLKTISLDKFYQPHCNWSFSNLSVEEWFKNLSLIAEDVEK